MPWPQTSPADSVRRATAQRLKQFTLVLSLLAGAAAAVALAALVPLLAGTVPIERVQSQLLIVLFPAALSFGALLGLVLVQWRARRLAADTLRRTARELQRGAWRSAVERMRDMPPAEPSAFGDLADQVEGVMGESERRWQARVELSSEWHWETDERHRLSSLSADAPLVKPAGRALGDLLGRRHDELNFLRAPAGGWSAFNHMLERQEGFRDFEFEVDGLGRHARGWMSITGRPRYHRDGRFAGFEGVGHDITVHKESFRRLQASEQRYAAFAGLAADWTWATDHEHRFVRPDEEARSRLGDLAVASEGRTRWELYPHALPEAQWRAHRADLDAGRPFHGLEFHIARGDGTPLWVSESGTPRFDEAGRFVGYHGIGRDITARKRTEQMLIVHNRQLQAAVTARTRELELANRDLEAFARHLAHELRTPIGHVQGLAELLRRRLPDAQRGEGDELLDLQLRATHEMLAMLEALLALARSSSEAIERSDVDLSHLAEEVIASLPAVERTAPVLWQVEPGLRGWASESQMRIVLANLLGNAAKFTRRTAEPVVTLSGVLGADGHLVYQVRDNGAGFDANSASRLFQPFHRLHDDSDYQGTGVGLTIVQRIIQRHGGAIRAIGELGRGACFEFSLGPREAAANTVSGSLPEVSQPQPLDSTNAPPKEVAA